MKKFIAENWFKLIITIGIIGYLSLYAFDLHVRAVNHNSEVYNFCITNVDKWNGADAGESLNKCLKMVYNPFHLPFAQY